MINSLSKITNYNENSVHNKNPRNVEINELEEKSQIQDFDNNKDLYLNEYQSHSNHKDEEYRNIHKDYEGLENNYENEVKVESLGPEILKEDKKNSTVYHRYYHVFKKGELEELLKRFENISIVESYFDHANWCCILRKEY